MPGDAQAPVLVEFEVAHPILQTAMTGARGIALSWEHSDTVGGQELALFWAEGGDFEAFESALADDPTVASASPVTAVGDRRLYKIELSERASALGLYPVLVEEGSVIHEVTGQDGVWTFRVSFADRASFNRVYEFCRDNDIDLEVGALFEQSDRVGGVSGELTDRQRDALALAVECGYFEIPRECTLADLADRLGISENAASERLRRAMKVLVQDGVSTE